jgi:hypothetical protein
MIIDATKPVDRPFSKRLNIPDEALARISPEEFIPADKLEKITVTG